MSAGRFGWLKNGPKPISSSFIFCTSTRIPLARYALIPSHSYHCFFTVFTNFSHRTVLGMDSFLSINCVRLMEQGNLLPKFPDLSERARRNRFCLERSYWGWAFAASDFSARLLEIDMEMGRKLG